MTPDAGAGVSGARPQQRQQRGEQERPAPGRSPRVQRRQHRAGRHEPSGIRSTIRTSQLWGLK